MSNKSTGNSFENEFAQKLSQYGFWVYVTINKAGGQPADVIAAKDSRAYLIDCKVCEKDIFPLSRIEENQYNAMMLFYKCNNDRGCFFAMKFSDDSVYLCPSSALFLAAENGIKSLSKEEIVHRGYGIPLRDWLGDN